MSKLLILLLFALVLNAKLDDGIPVYSTYDMKKIMGNVYELNVKEGDEFYIQFYKYKGGICNCSNCNEFKDSLYDFDKNGQSFKYTSASFSYITPLIFIGGSDYFKFKALKPSSNKISLKFSNKSPFDELISKFDEKFYTDYVIKINILPKEEAS